jgi:hypothetical protein
MKRLVPIGLRVLINSIRQQRMLKMMAIADDRDFSYDNEIELAQVHSFRDAKRRIRCKQ